ncbi:hypothetical protein QAD02_021478 [Eretmocerus hayati]|uniref:Uncharacterized protein n=1 Tax=Eretmocerus hayati TaxID=131215 RepID=A0ACC2PQK0_9HYME|nr:hypothetical protein QAD02_021478 [Eretmocerus hayati]
MTDFVSVDQNQTKQNRSNGDEDIPENDVNTEQRLENPELEVHSINEFNAGEDLASVISRGEIQHHSMEERIDINDNDDSPANDMSSSLVGGTVSEDQDNPKSYGDISEWPASMSTMQAQVDYWVRMGNSSIQNSDLKILQSKSVKQQDQNKVRQCTPGMFTRIVKKKRSHRLESKKFFCFIENMYVFFISSPTERYDLLMKILKENLPEGINRVLVPKRVDTNRWLSRGDAVESVYQGFDGYRIALSELSSSYDEAASLLGSMNKLETGVLLVFWNDILDRVNSTSLRLQSYNSDLNSSIILLISLCDYIESLRSRFEFYENRGKELVGSDEYDFTKKRRKEPNVRLIPLGEDQVPRVNLNGSEKFKNDFYMPIIDSLTKSLGQRIAAYKEVEAIFGFMRKLLDLTPEEIEVHARNVLEEYGDDLEKGLINELIQFKPFVGAFLEKEEEENICFEAKALKILMKTDTQAVFPNVTILLRTYLVLMTTNCTSERSFSKLKLIESRLRSMGENRLNNLTRMSAESDLMREMSFDDLIEEFANRKSRRVFI